MSRQDFGDQWPLTVAAGRLRCERHQKITFQWHGTTYAVTGNAEHGPYDDIADIAADGPGHTGKMPLTPLVDRGRELCVGAT